MQDNADSAAPDWANKFGLPDDPTTNNVPRTSTYVRCMPTEEGHAVIQIWATTNGRQFDALALHIGTARELIAQIAAALDPQQNDGDQDAG